MSGLASTHTIGHSLIEVLVSLALTSAGVIGFMHTQHWREATETELLSRSYAVMLAFDALRKMTATPNALSRYRTAYNSPPSLTTHCRQTVCSHSEIAAFHLAHWKCRLGYWASHTICRDTLKTRALLPEGDGRIHLNGDNITIEIRWRDAHQALQSFELRHALFRH